MTVHYLKMLTARLVLRPQQSQHSLPKCVNKCTLVNPYTKHEKKTYTSFKCIYWVTKSVWFKRRVRYSSFY